MSQFYKIQKQPTEVFYEKGVHKNISKFTGKHLCQSLFFNKVAGLKKSLTVVFSCEFCEIFKSIFFAELLRAASSEDHFPKYDFSRFSSRLKENATSNDSVQSCYLRLLFGFICCALVLM